MIPVENSKLFMQCKHSLLSWITHQVRFVVESRANVIIYCVMNFALYCPSPTWISFLVLLFQNCLVKVRVHSEMSFCQVSPP